jgi:hypothetical protein
LGSKNNSQEEIYLFEAEILITKPWEEIKKLFEFYPPFENEILTLVFILPEN